MKSYLKISILALLIFSCDQQRVHEIKFQLPDSNSYTVKEIFQISDEVENVFWNTPVQIIELKSGNFLLRDRNDVVFLEFNERGEFVGRFGEEGRGPGEFSFIRQSMLDPKGKLHVFDLFNARHTIFFKQDSTWQIEKTTPYKLTRTNFKDNLPNKIISNENGNILAEYQISPSASNIDTLNYEYFYLSKTDSLFKEAEEPLYLFPTQRVIILRSGSTSSYMINENLYSAFCYFHTTRDKLFCIKNNSNSFFEVTKDGQEKFISNLPYERKRLSKDEKVKLASKVNSFRKEDGNLLIKSLPNTYSYYKNVLFNEDSILIELFRSDTSQPNWVITNYEGEIIGSFSTPKDFNAIEVINDSLIIGTYSINENRKSLKGLKINPLR